MNSRKTSCCVFQPYKFTIFWKYWNKWKLNDSNHRSVMCNEIKTKKKVFYFITAFLPLSIEMQKAPFRAADEIDKQCSREPSFMSHTVQNTELYK